MNQVNMMVPVVVFVVGLLLTSVWRIWALSDSLEN